MTESERKVFYVEVGDMPVEEIRERLTQIKEELTKKEAE